MIFSFLFSCSHFHVFLLADPAGIADVWKNLAARRIKLEHLLLKRMSQTTIIMQKNLSRKAHTWRAFPLDVRFLSAGFLTRFLQMVGTPFCRRLRADVTRPSQSNYHGLQGKSQDLVNRPSVSEEQNFMKNKKQLEPQRQKWQDFHGFRGARSLSPLDCPDLAETMFMF